MESMFTTREPNYHKNLKRPVAQLFSMTNMRHYEPYADECTAIFIDSMRDLSEARSDPVDLSAWLQWYAFDVIACITFQRRFGFMEGRRDVDNMIGDLDLALKYVKVASQYPAVHPWLMGNHALLRVLEKVIPGLPDPLYSFVKV
jgi:cytochrome P450